MGRLTKNLDVISEHIRRDFEAQDGAREKAIPLSREVIRLAGHAIRAVHRHEYETAQISLSEASKMMAEAHELLKNCIELPNPRFIRDSEKI